MHGISPWSLIPGWGIAGDQSHQIVGWSIDKLSSSQSNFQVPQRTLSTPLPAHPWASVLVFPSFRFTVQKLSYIYQWVRIRLNQWPPIPASWTGYVHTRSKMHWTKACNEAWLSSGLQRQYWSLYIYFLMGEIQSKNGILFFFTRKLDRCTGEFWWHRNQNDMPWEDVRPWAATSKCQGPPWLNPKEFTRCSRAGFQTHIPIWKVHESELQ